MMTEALRGITSDRRRAVAVAIAAPLCVVLVVVGGWLVARDALAERARSEYFADDLGAAAFANSPLRVANVTDRWIYYFNDGTIAAAGAEDDDGLRRAESRLRTALTLASGRAECPVRFNLSLVLEWRADAAADAGHAVELYGEAAQIAADAPLACDLLPGVGGGVDGDSRTDGSGEPEAGDGSLGDVLDDAAQRNRDSAADRARDLPADGEPAPGGAGQAPPESTLDEIEDRLQDAEDERVRDGWQDGGAGAPPTGGDPIDEPW